MRTSAGDAERRGIFNHLSHYRAVGCIAFGLLVGSMGCGNPSPEPLRLSQEKFVPVLRDVLIAEVALQGLNPATKDSVAREYYAAIYAIHNVDSSDFNHDLAILKSDPERLQMYAEQTLNELNRDVSDGNSTND